MKKVVSIFTMFLTLAAYHTIQAQCNPNDPECGTYKTVDCAQCCAQGRWVSSECLAQCNSCYMRSDEAFEEAKDYPNPY